MASSFQQQVRQRKLLYLGLIVALFTGSILWRQNVVAALADRLAVREQSRGDVELVGAAVRLALTGSRGVATCVLWSSALEKQKKNQWNELEVVVRSLTRLQPHFITPWLFQSWNLAYNVSVESHRVRDKYFYITRGVELLAQGERQNRNHPDLRWSIGFYTQHKVCQSDDTNYLRSLFQLSLIPPNERDPARFWKSADGSAAQFNWPAFRDFVEKHPQLVRRLAKGMHRETVQEKRRLFLCERAEDVVGFLDDNFTVPSLYAAEPYAADVPARFRGWEAKADRLLDPGSRFPSLPPQHAGAFDPSALSDQSTPRDDVDGFLVAHAWYCYAQEPLPPPGALPGSSEDVTDRARQRRPRHMTTLIFRHYPAMARRYVAERLEQEGWFDAEGWHAGELFRESGAAAQAVRPPLVGAGVAWSQDAWSRARQAWERHGWDNRILFRNPADEQNTREQAERFARRYNLRPFTAPPMRREDVPEAQRRDYDAAAFMFEYTFYRTLTNFPHHLLRATVESRPETVWCRKMFYKAEQAILDASPLTALRYYQTPVERDDGGRRRKVDPLTAWREVLLANPEFRRDSFTQEQSAEIETRYLVVWNRYEGRAMKEQLARAARVVPLLPKFDPLPFRAPIVGGPFDGPDAAGEPLVGEQARDTVLTRMGYRRVPQRTGPPPNQRRPGPR